MPAHQVIHAKEVLAVADGHTFTNAAKFAGRKSSDAVAYPPDCTFQCQKTPALEMHHEGGPPILYNQAECERILRDVRRLD